MSALSAIATSVYEPTNIIFPSSGTQLFSAMIEFLGMLSLLRLLPFSQVRQAFLFWPTAFHEELLLRNSRRCVHGKA